MYYKALKDNDEVHIHRSLGPTGLVGSKVTEVFTTYFKHKSTVSDSEDFNYGSLGIGAKTKKNFFRHQVKLCSYNHTL